MLERDIVARIFKKVLKPLGERAFFFKVHGGPFQRMGIPDIIGCYLGFFVAIEVKLPGKEPTPIQTATIALLKKAGAYVIVATHEDDVVTLIKQIDERLAA